jgi:hypothetical protein
MKQLIQCFIIGVIFGLLVGFAPFYLARVWIRVAGSPHGRVGLPEA